MARIRTSIMAMDDNNNLPSPGTRLSPKLRVYAERLGITNFVGTDGWLSKYKKRYNLHNISRHGESASAPPAECIENERIRLHTELTSYSLDNIYNLMRRDFSGPWNLQEFYLIVKLAAIKKIKAKSLFY